MCLDYSPYIGVGEVVVVARRYATTYLDVCIGSEPFKAYWLRNAPVGLTFNNCTLCPHCIYVFRIYLRTNSDLCHLQHKLIGFYNRDEVFTARYELGL